MPSIAQNLVFGLFVGSIYGIGAVGLALVFGVLKILNVAHGELVMIGAYASFWLFVGAGIDPFLALLIVVPLMFAFGILLDLVLFERVTRLDPETKIKNSLLISFGLGLVLQNAVTLLWTGDERSIQTAYSGLGFQVVGVALPFTRLATFGIAMASILALWFFLQRTRWGRAVRATAEDWEAATQAGINIRYTYLFTFGLGAAAAGVAGALVGLTFGFTPAIGLTWTLKALIIVVLAGTGSILGAFPAGLLLGLAEAISGMTIGAEYREVVGLVLFLGVLLLRPQGLFGESVTAMPLKWIAVAVPVVLGALLPQFTNNSSLLNLLFLFFLFTTLSQSWNILAGFAGQISLGHAAFFGTGALVMRTLWLNGMPFFLAMVIAGLVAALFALIIGIPTFRLRGVYFSIGTLALAEALRITIGNLFPTITTMPIEDIARYDLTLRYYVAFVIALLTMLAAFLLLRSRASLGLFAIREDEEAAQASGVRPAIHKLAASGLSSFLAGLAGATFAFHQVSYYPAAPFSPAWSFDPLLITFVGGVGTLLGPVVGALFFVLVREQLALTLVNVHTIIFGILFILVVLVLPGGLMDIWERTKKRFAPGRTT